MRTGYDLVWLQAERTPHRVAIVDDTTERTLTFQELVTEIDAYAAGLALRGVTSGALIATALPNTLEHCLALLALQRLGAIPAPMNFRLPPAQIAAAAAEASMLGAIVKPEAAEEVSRAVRLVVTSGDGGDFADCRGDWRALPPPPAPEPTETGMIFYTSGTTGTPKAALIPHRASEPRVNWIAPVAGVIPEPDLRTLGLAPIFHALGYIAFHATLAFGGTYYTVSAFDPARAAALIERHRITFLFTVPTIFQALVSTPDYQAERFVSIKRIIMGGSAISPRLLDKIASEWKTLIGHGYGTTEVICPLYQRNPVGRPRTFECTYTQRVRVIRPGSFPFDICPAGEVGELIVEAGEDFAFSGYLKAEQTAEKVRDGWYYTGDASIRNSDGSFDIVGRLDDVIRSGAESIYPEEIEAILSRHPAVRDVCAIGLPDELWGERVVACVVSSDPEVTWRDYDAYCTKAGLAGFKRPKGYVMMAGLPRNALNKLQRKFLQQMIVERGRPDADGVIHVAA